MAPQLGANIVPQLGADPGPRPETARQFWQRLRDPLRWKSAAYDLAVWFLFGWALTLGLSTYSPGYPIIVGTPSIPTGIYWVDKHPTGLKPGDFVSFPFEPAHPWLKGRYGRELVHTKMVLGTAGDTLHADASLRLKLCRSEADQRETCEPAGQALPRDGKGRPLPSWVPPGKQYTLRTGELWVYSPHPKSLDSRYHGPVERSRIYGRATPIFLF